MNLMIVESPNKTKKLESILGPDWKVMASAGHIRDLPSKELGIDIPEFHLNYVYIPSVEIQGRKYPGGQERVARISKELSKAKMVYLATDPDREGEAIAWHLKESLGLKEDNYVRVTFDAITEDVVSGAISKARKLDIELVHAQEARRALDRVYGYLVSPLVSNMLGMSLSAGRVQSPAVRLVVDLERRISAFKKTNHFSASVTFDNGTWQAEWNTKPFITDEKPYVMDEALAKRAAACRQFRVMKADSKQARQSPPSPFSTSLLLQAASVSLKYNPDITSKLAQKLFEQGVITYIRTDSVNFSDEAIREIRSFANGNGWPVPDKPRRFKEKQGAQEAHEAIRPTHIDVEHAGEDEQQRALYDLIWKRTVASQLSDAVYKVNTLVLETHDSEQTFEFKAKGRVLVEKGWRVLTESDAVKEKDEGDEEDANSGTVPLLAVDSSKQAENGKVLYKETKPPQRYTQASLIAKLENEGIGRPSTYPAIMKNIMGKGYLKEEKRYLKPTDIGVALVDQLVKAEFSFMELPFTRQLEEELDEIAHGKRSYLDVIAPAYTQLQFDITAAKNSPAAKPRFECPKCKSGMRRFSPAGKPPFWHCTNDECGHFMDDDEGKPVTHSCPKCKSPLKRYQKMNKETGKPTGGYGWFCTKSECKTFMEDEKGKPKAVKTEPCPACGKPMIRRKGTKGYWWGCSGYKSGCKVTMDDVKGKPVKRKGR